MFHVYHLIDPRDKVVRYVGRCTDPKARFRNHCNEAKKRCTTDKHRWIRSLLDQGLLPVLVTVGRYADADESRQAETDEAGKHAKTIFNIHDPARFPAVIAKKGHK